MNEKPPYTPLTWVYMGKEPLGDFPFSKFQGDVQAPWHNIFYRWQHEEFVIVVPVPPENVDAVREKYPTIQRIEDHKVPLG